MTDPTPSSVAGLVGSSFTEPFRHVDEAYAASLAGEHWGLAVESANRLDTERDDSFVIDADGGPYVLKIAHPLDSVAIIDLQVQALTYLQEHQQAIPVPTVLPTKGDELTTTVPGADGEPRTARLMTFLNGDQLNYERTTPTQRFAIGVMHARLSMALADFRHPESSRYLEFDLKQLSGLRSLLGHIDDPRTRDDIERVLDDFDGHGRAALAASRQQVIHNDLNADNLLVDPGSQQFVVGILDFGDLVHGSIVADLGIAMCYAVPPRPSRDDGASPDPWAAANDIAAGFESLRPLTDAERALLPHLVQARLTQRLLLNSWIAAIDPDNAHYTARTNDRSASALRRLLS